MHICERIFIYYIVFSRGVVVVVVIVVVVIVVVIVLVIVVVEVVAAVILEVLTAVVISVVVVVSHICQLWYSLAYLFTRPIHARLRCLTT
jgi:hypothetical protein